MIINNVNNSMICTKSQFICVSLVVLMFVLVGCEEEMNSDSELYSEDMYQQLKEEYSEDMLRKDRVSTGRIPIGSSDDQSVNDDTESVLWHHSLVVTTTESYPNAAQRLNCENPWIWNTFKCVWLDLKNHNISDRTSKNGKIVTYIAGPPAFLILGLCCCATYSFCVFRSRVKKFKKLKSEFQEKYKPGQIVLPTGEVKTFPPTEKEEEALEKLMLTLTSVV